MSKGFELLQSRERLLAGRDFLRKRPRIAALGAAANAALLASSNVPAQQRLLVSSLLAGTIAAFFGEAWWLSRHALSERWLWRSLLLTLLALGAGASVAGGLCSPFLPLFFAPVVVGYAAFGNGWQSFLLFGVAVALLAGLGWGGPLGAFPELPTGPLRGALCISSITALSLLAVGVTSLVEARTRLARTLDALRADLLQEAERRAQSVEHLGAQVAHEVKNPLTAARGLAQLVERNATERDRQRLGVIVTEIDRALAVLHDYLSFAKPLGDLQLAPTSARSLLEDVALVLEARLSEKSLRVSLKDGGVELLVDRQRLRDALLNLALNAAAAAPPESELSLSAALRGDTAELVVADRGPGIAPELQQRLGQPFATGNAETGTGLGVLLAQSVARQHGGRLRYEDAHDGGTRAIIELPLRTS